ncbi:MAG TPA: hypothetical protein VLS93_12315 [Anaeromyxobacteraceae bacterium]|nr:hypothetical protein [Anaeromyxobacteraceae bacterium]
MLRRTSARVSARALRIAAAAAVVLCGCDMCSTGDLRCRGNVVQECSSTRNWEDLHDCGADLCGVGRDVCTSWFDPGLGEVWCCYPAP